MRRPLSLLHLKLLNASNVKVNRFSQKMSLPAFVAAMPPRRVSLGSIQYCIDFRIDGIKIITKFSTPYALNTSTSCWQDYQDSILYALCFEDIVMNPSDPAKPMIPTFSLEHSFYISFSRSFSCRARPTNNDHALNDLLQ